MTREFVLCERKMAAQRLMKEFCTLQKDREGEKEIVLYPVNDSSLFEWKGFIKGPPDTPFSDGIYELNIKVPVSISIPLIQQLSFF